MKPELQRRIQRYGWDKAASFYDSGWQDQLWPAQESMLAEADPQPGENILDISCGTGLVTFPLAELVQPNGHITGIDLSEKMIETAKTENAKRGFRNIDFFRMDAESLTFDDNSFDAVICSLGLMYFPFPEKALEEMYRVVKPGGKVTALVWGERKKCGWTAIFPVVDSRVKSDVCPLFFQLGTGNRLSESFKKAKFSNIKTQRFLLHLVFRDDEQACVAAFWGGAVALAYQRFDEKTRREVAKEYLDSIQKFKVEDGYHVPGEFLIGTGIKTKK